MVEPAAPPQPETEPAAPVADLALYCPSCMYDLRGLAGDQCPECGAKLDREKLAKSSIPWVHCGLLWRLLPPLKTARLVTMQRKAFAMEMARPADLRSAKQFRYAVVCWVWLILAVAWVLAVSYFKLDFFDLDTHEEFDFFGFYFDDWFDEVRGFLWLPNLIFGAMVWLYLYLITGVHTYWMHPKRLSVELQNRSLALSYYACAPVLLLMFPALMALGSAVMMDYAYWDDAYGITDVAMAIWVLGILFAALCLLLFLLTCVRLSGALAQRSLLQMGLMSLLLPLTWLGLGLLIFGGIPGIALFLYFVFATF